MTRPMVATATTVNEGFASSDAVPELGDREGADKASDGVYGDDGSYEIYG